VDSTALFAFKPRSIKHKKRRRNQKEDFANIYLTEERALIKKRGVGGVCEPVQSQVKRIFLMKGETGLAKVVS